MHARPSTVLRRWLPVATLCLALPLLVYVTVQQAQRRAADQPQVQLAEDAARALETGAAPDAVVGTARVDIDRSLSPFVIVYDTIGRVLAASGTLHGRIPVPPIGVIEYTRTNGEHRVTWRPDPSARIAAVLQRSSTGAIVLAGRSLREAEQAIAYTRTICLVTIALSLLGTLVATLIAEELFPERK